MVNSFATIYLAGQRATGRLAKRIAPCIKIGDIVLLHGDLGAGKTTFARALIHSMAGSDIEVPSPTFTLVQLYDVPQGTLWHFDLYRLKQPEDVYELGWEDALAEGIVVVEWPERLGGLVPATALTLRFGFEGAGRTVTLEGSDSWEYRIGHLAR